MGLTKSASALKLVILVAILALGLHAILWSRADVAPRCVEAIRFTDANGDGALTFRDLWPFVLDLYNYPYSRLGDYSFVKSALNFAEFKDRSCNGIVSQVFNIVFWIISGIVIINLNHALLRLNYRRLQYRKVISIDESRHERIVMPALDLGRTRFFISFVILIGILNALSIYSKAVRSQFAPMNKSAQPTGAKKPASVVEGQNKLGTQDSLNTKSQTRDGEVTIAPSSSTANDEVVKREQSRSGF